MGVRSDGPDTKFGYMTDLELEGKTLAHPMVMVNISVNYTPPIWG